MTKSPLFANAVTRRWPKKVLCLHPEPVAQDVDVADEHEVGVVRGGQVLRRERGVDGRFAVGGGRRAVRERGLERPFEARGEHVAVCRSA